MNTTIATTTFVLLVLAPSVFAAPCKISKSVYRDADSKGFELVFGASIPGVVMSRATATINYPKQNQIHSFSVTQSNGYGSIFLLGINANNKGLEYGDSFNINFFDQNFRSATPGVLGREIQAPKYAFISGLGSYDHYKRRSTASIDTPPLLGDLMWVFERCQ
jgi:hypothetical protein